jgi:hypothetical protein
MSGLLPEEIAVLSAIPGLGGIPGLGAVQPAAAPAEQTNNQGQNILMFERPTN